MYGIHPDIRKQNDVLQNNPWVKEEIRNYIKLTENKIPNQNLWDSAKAVPMEKFIA